MSWGMCTIPLRIVFMEVNLGGWLQQILCKSKGLFVSCTCVYECIAQKHPLFSDALATRFCFMFAYICIFSRTHIYMLPRLQLNEKQLFESSGKFLELKTLMAALSAKKHRVLLFSQMTRVLDILGKDFKHTHMHTRTCTHAHIHIHTPVRTH